MAQQPRPMDYQKSTDAAGGIGGDQPERKSRALADEAHAITHSVDRMSFDIATHPPRCVPKQRLGTIAEDDKSGDQRQDADRPVAPDGLFEHIRGMCELRRYARHGRGHLGDMFAHRLDVGGHHLSG